MRYWAVHGNWFARVNALHNILRKKSRKFAAATSRPISEWALLHAVYRTVEVELRIAKQHKCHYCCVCKNYRGGGEVMEDGKKAFLHRFSAGQKIASA